MEGVTIDRAHRWGDNPLPDDIFRSPRLEHAAASRGHSFIMVRVWRDEPLGKTVVQAHRDGLAAEAHIADTVRHDRAEWHALAGLDRALGPATATAPLDFEIVTRGP